MVSYHDAKAPKAVGIIVVAAVTVHAELQTWTPVEDAWFSRGSLAQHQFSSQLTVHRAFIPNSGQHSLSSKPQAAKARPRHASSSALVDMAALLDITEVIMVQAPQARSSAQTVKL